MGAAASVETKNRTILDSGYFEVDSGLKIEIPHYVDVESIRIRGFKKAEALASGSFTATAQGKVTTITFNAGDVVVGDTVLVSFERVIADSQGIGVKTNTPSAKGELWLYYPIYSDGADCTEATQLGRAGIHIYRVRATQQPGFDNSYKSASTNAITFSAMDAKRADNMMYELFVEKYDANGDTIPSEAPGK